MELVDRPHNIVQRVAWDLPSESGTVSEIRCLHAFEHFDPSRHAEILTEWRRVLCPGGLLTVTVPDAAYVLQYLISGPNKAWAYDMVFGRDSYPGDAHLTAWDRDRLEALLRRAGFSAVTSVAWDEAHTQDSITLVAVAP